VRLQHGVDRFAQAEVAVADDTRARAQSRAFGIVGHGRDVFGFTHRTQFLGPITAIGKAALDEHGGLHIVTGREISTQLVEQIAAGRPLPQMMVGIHYRQRRLEDVLAQPGEPGFVDMRMRIGLPLSRCRAHAGLLARTGTRIGPNAGLTKPRQASQVPPCGAVTPADCTAHALLARLKRAGDRSHLLDGWVLVATEVDHPPASLALRDNLLRHNS